MSTLKLPVALTIAVGLVLACSTTAFAEFKAHTKTTEGESGYAYATLEGGGASINCEALEEKSAPKWIIEKEGKPAESGAGLRVKVKTWGECVGEIKGVTRAMSSSECEMETQEPKEEAEVSATLLSTCTFTVEVAKVPCEIMVEPKENKERKSIGLVDSGENDENTILNFALKNITTSVKGALCSTLGVTSTHEGKMNGAMEALQVAPALAAPVFRVSREGTARIMGTQTRKVHVANFGTMGAPGASLSTAGDNGFAVGTKSLAECQMEPLAMGESCGMTVRVVVAPQVRRIHFRITTGGVVKSEVSVLGIE